MTATAEQHRVNGRKGGRERKLPAEVEHDLFFDRYRNPERWGWTKLGRKYGVSRTTAQDIYKRVEREVFERGVAATQGEGDETALAAKARELRGLQEAEDEKRVAEEESLARRLRGTGLIALRDGLKAAGKKGDYRAMIYGGSQSILRANQWLNGLHGDEQANVQVLIDQRRVEDAAWSPTAQQAFDAAVARVDEVLRGPGVPPEARRAVLRALLGAQEVEAEYTLQAPSGEAPSTPPTEGG